MQKKDLDPSKMFGFKIIENAQTNQSGDASTGKLAAKVGSKPSAVKLGSKIGGKAGMKLVTKTL